ncbi:MAG: hypothetical protein IT521_15715 [Burkholderiales bacterium]|nr:hypothetical protein [Burkholderiales bacterium]
MPLRAFIIGKAHFRAWSWVLLPAIALACHTAGAQSVGAKAKESGCVDVPRSIDGSMYRCTTASGATAYFNVPGADNAASSRRPGGSAKNTPTPAGFPKVDAETQRNRDDLRRRVLSDELAAEEKLLADARNAYANGAPVPLPEEQANAAKYQERITRLRQSVQLHERNIEALKKELGATR